MKRVEIESAWPKLREGWLLARPTLLFLVAWAFLNTALNLRYPSPEPAFWYVLPSADTAILFSCIAALAWAKVRAPIAARVFLVGVVLVVRVLRLGDGIQKEYYSQPFNLYTDLPLALELARFGHSTLGPWKFALALVAFVAGLGVLCWGLYRAFAFAERYLAEPRHVYVTAAVMGVAYGATVLSGLSARHQKLFSGGFASSAFKRLHYEAKFTQNLHDKSASFSSMIVRAEEQLSKTPSDLVKLRGKNVHLILAESYGEAVFERKSLADAIAPVLRDIESRLEQRGFVAYTGLLDSSTYGGRSWIAHATIGTGVKVRSQLEYEIVCAQRPKTLARFFAEAGHRTVLVQPGTTRAWPKGEFYGFQRKYYAWDFDYRGPPFAWATMPDEYVLEFIGRRELVRPSSALFVQYTLVSSHAPWSDIPVLVEDPNQIGDGAIYHKLPRLTFPIEFPHFENASEAYIRSVSYSLSSVARFLERYVNDDALVIVLGDHQPVKEVTENSPSFGVPVHVLSRDNALLEPFRARGYEKGLRPRVGAPRAGLETFMASLLADFSSSP